MMMSSLLGSHAHRWLRQRWWLWDVNILECRPVPTGGELAAQSYHRLSGLGCAGGGGGAGAVGQDGTHSVCGAGGAGIPDDISGTQTYYGGGGGGGSHPPYSPYTGGQFPGAGGQGGGGAGGSPSQSPRANDGASNTGGGGGGSTQHTDHASNPNYPGGNGGSGIVIVQALSTQYASACSTTWPSSCDYGQSLTEAHCGTAASVLAVTASGRPSQSPGRALQRGSGGSCNDNSWGCV